MENIISIVGFLGAGKTTILKRIISELVEEKWNPYVILNDYENAYLDAQQFYSNLPERTILPLSGSCVCCSGLQELRDFVNKVPAREKGITLIEANGTTDSCSLQGFLGVGLESRFAPPVQISVVDVKNWQKRGEHNELEANQIQLSSLILLTHTNSVDEERILKVKEDIKKVNSSAKIIYADEFNVDFIKNLQPSQNKHEKLEHSKSHWSSCSIDLPKFPDKESIIKLCEFFPKSILRIKGCVIIGEDKHHSFFEKTPDGTINIRSFKGYPVMGSKLLIVGLGSNEELLQNAIEHSLALPQ